MSRKTYVRKAERALRHAKSCERGARMLEDEYGKDYRRCMSELRYWQREVDRRKQLVNWR